MGTERRMNEEDNWHEMKGALCISSTFSHIRIPSRSRIQSVKRGNLLEASVGISKLVRQVKTIRCDDSLIEILDSRHLMNGSTVRVGRAHTARQSRTLILGSRCENDSRKTREREREREILEREQKYIERSFSLIFDRLLSSVVVTVWSSLRL